MTKLIAQHKPILWIVLVAFLFNTLNPPPAQADVAFLPAPGKMVSLTPSFSPPLIRGLKVFKNNPFKFEFIMSEGDTTPGEDSAGNSAAKQAFLKEEGNKLVKYFLASLTVPAKDMWVNLSPYERNRIIPSEFGLTEMGKEVLAQDYLLKQVTASVMYPEGNVGREFWRLIYQEAYKRFGTTNISVSTFNKVWIVPETAVVYENAVDNTAVITESKLNVMLEEDYLALDKSALKDNAKDKLAPDRQLSNELIRQVILPLLKKEVNTGKNFAVLRQVYNSLILALWYKNKLKQSLISQGYVDRKKINGVNVADKDVDQEIYRQYLKSYKKGVYNYIKEEISPTNEIVPRKYFSGGVILGDAALIVKVKNDAGAAMDAKDLLRKFKMYALAVGVSAVMAAGTANARTIPMGNSFIPNLQPEVRLKAVQTDISVKPVNQPSVSMPVLRLGSTGPEVTEIGAKLKGDADSIRHLTGENPITHRQYDSKYLLRNADKIYKRSLAAIRLGEYTEDVRTRIVAEERERGLPENGIVNDQFRNAINSSGQADSDTVSSLFGNSPVVTSLVTSLSTPRKATVNAASGNATMTTADVVNQGGPLIGPQPTVNSGAVYAGGIDQEYLKAQGEITAAAQAMQDNLNEQQALSSQIQANSNAGGGTPPPPDEIAAQQRALINEYHLTVPDMPAVPLPYQSPGVAPPIAEFHPDAVGIAYINNELNQIQEQNQTAAKRSSPVKVVPLFSNNRFYVGAPIGGTTSINIVPAALPFGDMLNLSQMGQGMAHFGVQSTLNQVAGPFFATQIMLELRNYVTMHPTKGQDVLYNVHVKNRISGIVQTLTIHVVPIRSFDQQGNLVEEHLYSVGLVDTLQAALGKLDGVLGGRNVIGDGKSHFVTSNLGYQIEVNDYHKAFTHAARFNKDTNTSFINVYNINDPGTRYRKNKHNGWDVVPSSTPLDGSLDFYSATVNGFILRFDPATGSISGQRAYTAATFVTGVYAKRMAEENGTKIVGDSYLDPNATFMERVSSIDDLNREKTLLTGVDEQGRIIWGVLRDPVSGRIARFITDPLELNTVSRLKDEQGRTVIGFVQGADYQGPSGAGAVIKDYTVDQFKDALKIYKGIFHPGTQNAQDHSVEILSQRPALTQIPDGLRPLFQNNALIFSPARPLEIIAQLAKDHYGMIYFVNGRFPAVLTSLEHVKTIDSLNASNGVQKLPNGMYALAGTDKDLDGKTLVFLDDQGKAVGIIDPSDKLRQERINDLRLEFQHSVEWKQGLENYGVGIDANNEIRSLMAPANEFFPARYAGVGVVGQVFGINKVTISGDMLVRVEKVDGKNVVVEILQSGEKTMALWKQGLENYGVAIDRDNNARPLMEPANTFTRAKYAGDGVVGQSFGKNIVISEDMLVRAENVNGKKTVVEVMEIGQKTAALWQKGMDSYGIAIDGNNNLRPLLTPADEFIPAKFYSQGVVGQSFGNNGTVISGDMLVRTVKVNGKNIVVEILEPGKKAIEDHQVVLNMLAQGGIEAVDRRSIDPRTGNFKVVYFVKGNKLTAQQKAYNFHPEKELVDLVLRGQATTVTAKGTKGKRQWVILEKAPESGLRGLLQGNQPQQQGARASRPAAAHTPAVPTLFGPDGKIFHGVTVTTEVFTAARIPELNRVNATAIRTYYPIPPELVEKIIKETKVRTFIVGIPYNASAYNPENLSNFWGEAVTADSKISLEGNNYIPYLSKLQGLAGHGVEIVADLGNELNLHPDWLGKADNIETRKGLFREINKRALELKSRLPNIKTTFTLGDREEDFTLALQTAPAVDIWGINYYRHNNSLVDSIKKAFQASGIRRPFYIAEMGIDSSVGNTRQAAIVTQDLQRAMKEMGVSNILMTLDDDPQKKGTESLWGLFDKNGKPKPVVAQMENGLVGPIGVPVSTLAELNRNYFQVVLKNGKGTVYVSLDQLKDPTIYEAVRRESSEVTMRGANQEVTARVSLSKNIYGSRIEVMQKNNESLVFELPSFSPSNLSYPVAKTSSFTDPKTKLLHVRTTDLRQANKGVVVEDVYKPVPNGPPVKIYSDRILQQERIFFENGHETYSVSMDPLHNPGQAVMIGGQLVEHVTGIYDFDETNDKGYYIGLQDIESNGWFAPIRLSSFEDGLITMDQTGYVKISKGLNDKEIKQRAKSAGVLNMKDVYTYQGGGQFDSREISFLVNGTWQPAWTLKGSDIAPISEQRELSAIFDKFSQNAIIAGAFKDLGIDKNTQLVQTVKSTPDGVTTLDYRIAGDVLEKKIITVIKQDGVAVKVIVGLAFNPQSGEQTLSYNLTPDGQIESLSQTVPNTLTFAQLLSPGMSDEYTRYMKEHMNIAGADLSADLLGVGVSTDFVPVLVKETPFMIQTDNPNDQGYKLIESRIRPLIEEYKSAKEADRQAILTQISDIVREYHRGTNSAHYTNQEGGATYHYLAPPNDSRGRDFITKMSNGETVLNLWWLEGQGSFKANILPGSIVIGEKGLKQTMAFDHTEDMVFKDAKGEPHTLRVNVYNVYHNQNLVKIAFTSMGQRVFETGPYVVGRIANGMLGVQTNGFITIFYDPVSPYPLPLYGVTNDGRLATVTMDIGYQSENGQQEMIARSLDSEPTARDIFKPKQQLIQDGQAVAGTLKELGVWQSYLKEVKNYLPEISFYPLVVLLSFFTGAYLRDKKFRALKKKILSSGNEENEENIEPPTEDSVEQGAVEQGTNGQQMEAPAQPSWKAYGFKEDAVKLAKEQWKNRVLVDLKNNRSWEDIFAKYFGGYQIWRKEVMGIEEPFTPTVEDLWVKFLIDVDCDIFNTGMPDGLNYLYHKGIEEARSNPRANVGEFTKKTVGIFADILQRQHTTFQGLEGGDAKNVVPGDYYVGTDDFEEWFRTKGFIEWFDNLGYTFDGQTDARKAIYDDFMGQLIAKVDAVKSSLLRVATEEDKETGKMKELAGKQPAYQEYVDFFNSIQRGDFKLSDQFTSQVITREEAMQRINGKPLIYKTFGEGSLPVGKLPFFIRVLKPVAQVLRNSYNQLRNNIFLTSATGLAVAVFNGYMSPGSAAITAAIGVLIAELFNRLLNFWLDKDINIKAHGKPKPFSVGYKMAGATKEQKWYRSIFWTSVITLKIAWDAYLIQKFFIPHFETIHASYFPLGSPINLNPLLMIQQWSIGAMFLFVFAWASNYLVITPMIHIFAANKGIGTIKSAKDIRALIDQKILIPLMIKKLLPKHADGLGTAAQQENAVKQFIKRDYESHRSRDDVSDTEGRKIVNGQLDQYGLPSLEYRKIRSVNSLVMDSPAISNFDNIENFGIGMPVYEEDTIPPLKDIKDGKRIEISKITSLWEGERILRELIAEGVLEEIPGSTTEVKIKADLDLKKNKVRSIIEDEKSFEFVWDKVLKDRDVPTALDMWVNTGYTNLNWIISRSPERWENLIERLERMNAVRASDGKGPIASEEELARMRALIPEKGKVKAGELGDVSEELGMEIRLWAAYASQPFARTLDGVMNIVRVLQYYCQLAHPDWSKEMIQKATNEKFQIIWAYQIWGDIVKAGPARPDLLLKKADTEFLVKKYYDELGFIIDIASLEVRDGMGYKVLYRYDPDLKRIKEVYAIELTKNRSIAGEGKAYNQEKAFSFARADILGLWDMNMDLDFWEAANILKVVEEFKDPKIALVNFPEIISSAGFSKTATSLADSDEQFGELGKWDMANKHSPMHHGHPDFVRISAMRESGGFSSGPHVSEDYIAGLRAFLRGFKMIQVQYAKAIKFREFSWFGSLGMFTKFAMGAAQKLLSRYSAWRNDRLGPISGAAEFYTGPAFYLLQIIATLGFFQYLTSVMVLGISPFTALPAPLTTMLIGVGLVGQALTGGGLSKMVLEEGFIKGFFRFFVKSLYFTAPLFIAHMFSYQAGFLLGLAGAAAYIATGRGYFREHIELDRMFKLSAKSHTVIGAAGLALSAFAFSIWQNTTFFFSAFTVISFLFPLTVPFFLNPGTYPGSGVTWKKASELYKIDMKRGMKKIVSDIRYGWNRKILGKKQVEEAGLDWQEISDKLIRKGLAKKVDNTEIMLWSDLKTAQDRLGPNDPDLQGILKLLKSSAARDYKKIFVDSIAHSITYGVWFTLTLPVGAYTGGKVLLNKFKPQELVLSQGTVNTAGSDKAALAKAPGGIDLGKTVVSVKAGSGVIQTAFDDPAMLRLLLNADGLAPIIYNIKTMTPSMVDHFVGVDQ